MKQKNYLITGPIQAFFLAEELEKLQNEQNLGAHSIFVGTVRADQVDRKTVRGIEYSAYEDMIAQVVLDIKDQVHQQYPDVHHIRTFHSTGLVRVSENSLLVLVSAGHRKQAFTACAAVVELIKEKLPVWKKELYADGSHQWLGANN